MPKISKQVFNIYDVIVYCKQAQQRDFIILAVCDNIQCEEMLYKICVRKFDNYEPVSDPVKLKPLKWTSSDTVK